MPNLSFKQKDFLDRLFWTLSLAGVSFGITYLADADEIWGLAILAALQSIKSKVAQQVGDKETSGFADPNKSVSTKEAEALPEGDPDGVERDISLDGEIVDIEEGA